MRMKVPSTTTLSFPTLSPLLTVGKDIFGYFLDRLFTSTERPPFVGKISATRDRGCCVISTTDPYGRILGFLDQFRYFFSQVAPQLYSWGWVDPVPDPLFLRKSGSSGNRIWVCSQEFWPLYHRRSPVRGRALLFLDKQMNPNVANGRTLQEWTSGCLAMNWGRPAWRAHWNKAATMYRASSARVRHGWTSAPASRLVTSHCYCRA
jgi:hypothetical protein